MYKKHCFLLALILVVSTSAGAAGTDPDLFGWWTLDEGSGAVANDSSGNGINATLVGNPTWITGVVNGALELDGVDDEGRTGRRDLLVNWTVACWARGSAAPALVSAVGPINCQTNYQMNWDHATDAYRGAIVANIGGAWYAASLMPLEGNTWYHLVGTYDGSAIKSYRDGVLVATTPITGTPTAASATRELLLGGSSGGRFFRGALDDVRIYKRALTEEEIQQIIMGPPAVQASSPSPTDGATDVPRDVILSWTPSEFAARHDVYLGTGLDDVNNASPTVDPAGVYTGRQDLSAYAPAGLEFGRHYYWRVDEVNAPPDSTVFKGSIWQFTVEPFTYPIAGKDIIATASSVNSANEGAANTINSSGLDADDLHSTDNAAMWLSSITGAQPTWIQYGFDKVYKLHEMWVWNHNSLVEPSFGLGIKEAVIEYSEDGSNWNTLGTVHEFARATGAPGYEHNTVIDLGGVTARYVKITANSNWGGIVAQYGLSEVRFLYVPVQAREPNPDTGSTGAEVDNVALTWRAGREAAKHEVYLGTDEQAVIAETVSPASVPAASSYASYNTGALDLNKTYYWKVNEVNDAAAPAVWRGDVWNFNTQEFLVVDDFEQYNDTDNKIYDEWADYFVNNTGATVGHFDPPFAEKTIVHTGSQSMPYHYDNDGVVNEGTTLETTGTLFYSEAQREWTSPDDWTRNGAEVLTLWFRGLPPLYGSFIAGPPMTMTARGAGIAGSSDQLHFAYQPLSGDASITAKVVSLTNTGTAAAAGVMIRESLSANAMQAMVAITPTSGVVFVCRSAAKGNSTTIAAQAGVAAPQWIRLSRKGRTFTAEYSSNGTAWTALGEPQNIAMSTDAYIGLSLTSGTASATCTAEFSNVTSTVTGPRQSQDIGIESNVAEQLYVALQDSSNNSAVVRYPEPGATTIDTWTEWNIPLADFGGVNPRAIKKFSLGVGDRANPQRGGSGMLYIDDLRLRPALTPPLDPDLVMYYPLDGNPTDGSGNGYHGTLQGDPQWTNGVIGGALEFNGNDLVKTGNTEQLDTWTVACWVISPAAPKVGAYGALVNRQGNYQVNWDHTNDVFMGVAAVNVGGFKAAGFGPVEANTWYHIAATYDGNALKAYRDGVLITTTEVAGVPAKATRDMQFGTGSFVGTLDDVRVYRRALNDAEVAALAGMAVKP